MPQTPILRDNRSWLTTAAASAVDFAGLAGVEIRVLAGFLCAATLLLFAGGFAYRASVEFSDSIVAVAGAYDVRGAVADLDRDLADAEASLHDYVLTGNSLLAGRYLRCRESLEAHLAALTALSPPGGDQQHTLERLRPLIARQEAEMTQVMTASREHGLADAQRALAGGSLAVTGDAIGALLRQMTDLQVRSVAGREAAVARVRRISLLGLLGAIMLIAALFVALFRSVHREVLGRAKAERALRASERYNRSIVENSPDCVELLTLDARLTEMTAQGCRLMGIEDFARHKGADWLDFWTGADRVAAAAALEAARGGGPGRFQGYCPMVDGTPKWWDVIVAPIPGGDGRPERLLAVSRDLTEAKRAEATLIETNRFLDSLIEAIPNMIFVKDAAELRYVRVNRAGEQLLGLSKEHMLGRIDADLFPAEEAHFFVAHDRAALAGGRLLDIPEETVHTRERGLRTLHTMKMPIPDETGRPRFLLGISADITERKQGEAAFRILNAELRAKAAQLETSIRELESFSYSVSHDLRAPLRAIDGFALMLEEDYRERLDEEGRRFLAVIRGNSQRMGALIDDLLEFSRLGRQPVAKSEVDMEALAREVLDEQLALLPDRLPRVVLGALPAAHADPRLLRQVWVNLLSNACKYTSKSADPAIEISGRATGAETIYAVRDNGVGFDMEYCDKLFQVFQRLHRSDEFGGTGVGLAIVHRVVSRHGGRVWATGQVGKGAVFSFALPVESGHG